jgi:hypothetical protein
VNLNGFWDFAFDDQDRGIGCGWFEDFPAERKIRVPFAYETPASGIGDPSAHGIVWYRRVFSVEEDRLKSGRVMLHFEGSDYHSTVWINGRLAGDHEGAYSRFSLDISPWLKAGGNSLVVRVKDSFDKSQCRGKQRWRDSNFGCWYIQTTGIWKTVWLEFMPREHIQAVKMTPLLPEGKLEIEYILPSEARSPGTELEAVISFEDIPVTSVTIPAGGERLMVQADINSREVNEWGLCLWSPAHPRLYDISFRLKQAGKIADEVFSYFGMREIRVDGANVLLNGRPLYQRLILDQGYWKDSGLTPPDEQALIDDIDKVIAAGYNGVRKHQKIEDERFLYWADVKGLLVWSEMAAAYEFNDRAVTGFTREWMEIVRQHYNHPSIITWTPFNESWGVPGIKTDAAQQNFTKAVYYLTKSYDPYRPVITNDGWEHTVSDIITLHDYEERGEDLLDRYLKHMNEILSNRVYHNTTHSAFAEGSLYRGQPVILSEFGGIAFSGKGPGWGYGGKVAGEEEFIKRFDAITTAIKRIDAISGYCYTQLTDVQQEINGLMDMDRNFKVDPLTIKEINQRKIGNLR